ncbi:MAG: aconitase/3-isopropylmalate dehydratase large subunit family protein [Promethearchaeota archaeon]
MGQSLIEKIIEKHTTEDVAPGKIIWLELDVRSARDFGGANVVQHLDKYYPSEAKVQDPQKTFFTFDCNPGGVTIDYAKNQQICREFAKREGIKVFDIDQGIGSHLMIDAGIAVPGTTVVGTDSHLNIMGAIGAFGQGMGDQDIAFAWKTGKTWFEVPYSIKVIFEGNPFMNGVISAKDLTLAALQHFGSSGLLGLSAEFYGSAIENLSLDGRITLASQVTEMGGIIGLISPNDTIIDYSRSRSGDFNLSELLADEDAQYLQTEVIDLTNLEPLIACPPSPANVKTVSEVSGKEVHSVFIGSCTNGRYEDIRVATDILRGELIAPNIVCKLVPATREIWSRCLKEGLIEDLYDAGVLIGNTGCAGCAQGQIGMTGVGEVAISTGNRNFPGKQGAGDMYLASPATAAAAALIGEIIDPREI